MKEDINYYDDSDADKKGSGSKIITNREAFTKKTRNMRRMHSNSILNQLRLSQKINQENLLIQQQKSLIRFQNSRKNSMVPNRNKSKMSDFYINAGQYKHQNCFSQFIEPDTQNSIPSMNPSKFSNQNEVFNIGAETSKKKTQNNKQFVIKSPKHKIKNQQQKPKNLILSSINTKIRQIDVISKTFDKVNSFFTIDHDFSQQNYSRQCEQTSKFLKQFEQKILLRKNKINERRSSKKMNSKMEYRYKANFKRYQTECTEKQNSQPQNKFQGLWNQNARKMKNYITGGYNDEKEDYSDFCDIEEYRRLKNNFKTFQQIYSNIKDDKDNPIGKISKINFKQPSILEVVTKMEKQHELLAPKHRC